MTQVVRTRAAKKEGNALSLGLALMSASPLAALKANYTVMPLDTEQLRSENPQLKSQAFTSKMYKPSLHSVELSAAMMSQPQDRVKAGVVELMNKRTNTVVDTVKDDSLTETTPNSAARTPKMTNQVGHVISAAKGNLGTEDKSGLPNSQPRAPNPNPSQLSLDAAVDKEELFEHPMFKAAREKNGEQ